MPQTALVEGLLTALALATATGAVQVGHNQDCRTASTASTIRAEGLRGFASTTSTTCQFDRRTTKSTCTNQYEDTTGTRMTTVAVTTYANVADVVDEVRVIPPLRLSVRLDTTGTGTRETQSSLVNTYDDQRRLIKEVATSKQGTAYTTTYTSWDKSGRPTAGSTVFTNGPTTSLEAVYDDATRTVSTTTTANGQRISCEMVYDANGNPVSTTCSGPAGPRSKSVTTTMATERICR